MNRKAKDVKVVNSPLAKDDLYVVTIKIKYEAEFIEEILGEFLQMLLCICFKTSDFIGDLPDTIVKVAFAELSVTWVVSNFQSPFTDYIVVLPL